jgi:hypothetical protein
LVRFFFRRSRKKLAQFQILAQRLDKEDEQYEILIQGSRKIKHVMEQFDQQYVRIVEHLRIMADALVLLNPQSVPPLTTQPRLHAQTEVPLNHSFRMLETPNLGIQGQEFQMS